MHIAVKVHSIRNSKWITARPPRQPGRVVPRPVVVESTFLIPLLACEAVALARIGAKAGLAVGRVLFTTHPRAGSVDNKVAAAQVVAEVVRYGGRIGALEG